MGIVDATVVVHSILSIFTQKPPFAKIVGLQGSSSSGYLTLSVSNVTLKFLMIVATANFTTI
jgi:hypothetical protein